MSPKLKWRKLGLIFSPLGEMDWMHSHASYPVAEHLGSDMFRIYFSSRDKNNHSSVGFVDIDIYLPGKIINISKEPVLSPGELGAFDNDGVTISCILHFLEKRYLYYLGWNLCKTVPFCNTIGLAISNAPESSFVRYSNAPILGRDTSDPFTISYPWVIYEENKWKMWYGSHLKWGDSESRDIFEHVIKYAESEDGIRWKKHDLISLYFDESNGEYAISKPCVIKEGNLYKMWYSFRGNEYRIGYAESRDGIKWVRKDSEVGIDVSDSGWDSESIEYPFVFDHKGQQYMLYNGNGYGKTGFGLAILEHI